MTCADATNFYDRLIHSHASLCSPYFGMDLSYLVVLFGTIQNMKMHLRTFFVILTNFYTSNVQHFQGTVQSNGAAPALWLIISIFFIICLYQQKVVTSITNPISKLCQLVSALLHVDDKDLYVFNSGSDKTENIVSKAQRVV